jgi:hypothetical protein
VEVPQVPRAVLGSDRHDLPRHEDPGGTWIFVVFDMASSKNGLAAREIERKYDLTPKSAWYMCHRIREAMKREPMAGLLTRNA